MREFPNLTAFIRYAQPGDRHTVEADGNRIMSTYVCLERKDGYAIVTDEVKTMHFGKSDLYGRREKYYASRCYRVPIEVDNGFIKSAYGFDAANARTLFTEDCARHSAKALQAAHVKGVKVYDEQEG